MFADQSRKHLREFPEMAIMLTEREPVLSNSRDHHPEVRAAQARGIYAAPGGSQSYALLRKRKVRNDSSLGSSGHGLAHLAFALTVP
jgi:hypothetical protein